MKGDTFRNKNAFPADPYSMLPTPTKIRDTKYYSIIRRTSAPTASSSLASSPTGLATACLTWAEWRQQGGGIPWTCCRPSSSSCPYTRYTFVYISQFCCSTTTHHLVTILRQTPFKGHPHVLTIVSYPYIRTKHRMHGTITGMLDHSRNLDDALICVYSPG